MRQAQGINAELGLGATIDIAIEFLAEKAEKEIVCSSGKNLIGHCGPFLSKLCRNLAFLQKVIVCWFSSIYLIFGSITIFNFFLFGCSTQSCKLLQCLLFAG